MVLPARSLLVLLARFVLVALTHPAWGDDPLILNERFKLQASDSLMYSIDCFGSAIAISGDTAVVGAPGQAVPPMVNAGAVYVFARHGSIWYEQAKIVASDASSDQLFGLAVAISRDTVAVGSVEKVYVFARSGLRWYEQAQLPGVGPTGLYAGTFLGISEDILVVGKASYNDGQGTVYVYERSGASWLQQAQLFAPDERPLGFFGQSLAISGDTLVIGASSLSAEPGEAYVFVHTNSAWSLQARLLRADPQPSDAFGHSVAISQETVAVGDPYWGEWGAARGAVDVFTRSGSAWSHQAKVLAPAGDTYTRFGDSVAILGDTLVAGMPGSVGSAHVFTRSGSLWSERETLLASDGWYCEQFGSAVAFSNSEIIVGTLPCSGYLGSAYVFPRAAVTVSPSAGLLTTESGGTAAFAVVLNTQPAGDVVIDLASTDTDEVSIFPTQLTFTPADWETARTVTLTGVDDLEVDDGQPYAVALTTNTALTEDVIYDGIDPVDVSALNLPFVGDFYTVPPCRLLDTRLPDQGPALASGLERTVMVHDVCEVPPTARAVALIATVAEPTGAGQLTLYPGGLPRPGVGTCGFTANANRACGTIVPLAAGGTGTLTAWPVLDKGGPTHLALDVSGYFE